MKKEHNLTTKKIMKELEGYGNETTKNTLIKHGAKEPFFGVKVQDLKKIQKKVKKDYELSLELYNTGNSDAMYLAGLIADEVKMTKKDLNSWVKGAYWYYISEYAVPWVAAESRYGFELGMKWIESKKEMTAAAGWATLAHLTMIKPDEELDLKAYETLLKRVQKEINDAPNRVRYTMNGFVIAVGANVKPLTKKAIAAGKKLGKIHVDMGGTACKVPLATEHIQKVIDRGSHGKKRKTARC